MGIDLSLIWVLIIAFGLMMYVVMDGCDLGIGILFPFVPATKDRDIMVNTVAPVWDGNETWLVLGGAGLLAAFPIAYGVLLSALYIPILLMLMGLILRGVAFEFRFKAELEPPADLGFRVRQRVISGGILPGCGVGRVHRWVPGDRSLLRRRRARLADAVQRLHRTRRDRLLCAAGWHLADPEDRGRAAGAHDRCVPPDRAGSCWWGSP